MSRNEMDEEEWVGMRKSRKGYRVDEEYGWVGEVDEDG